MTATKEYPTEYNVAHTKFLITTISPYGPPHKDTIARWVKNTLTKSSSEYIFSSHSCRLSASSKANNMGLDLDAILKMGCWSQQSTFQKFYSKELEYMGKNNSSSNHCKQSWQLKFVMIFMTQQ